MSFILDALKKSETERQQQGGAEFAGVPTSRRPSRAPRWLWVLGLLLAINLAVLLGLLMKPETRVASVDVEASPPAVSRNDSAEPSFDERVAEPGFDERVAEPSFAERVAEARRNAPRREEPAPEAPPPAQAAPAASFTAAPQAAEQGSPGEAALPTFIEVLANGTIQVPDLHLDIHVYSEVPEDRFVFINMSKQREQSQLSEGPVVEEITPNGVVLDYQGTSFFLPRD